MRLNGPPPHTWYQPQAPCSHPLFVIVHLFTKVSISLLYIHPYFGAFSVKAPHPPPPLPSPAPYP